jgi:hypothetical protein
MLLSFLTVTAKPTIWFVNLHTQPFSPSYCINFHNLRLSPLLDKVFSVTAFLRFELFPCRQL